MGLWSQCWIVKSIWDCGVNVGLWSKFEICGVNVGLWSQCGIVVSMWD